MEDSIESDVDILEENTVLRREACIFLIDASSPMFMFKEDSQTEDCPFVTALKCAHRCLRDKILTSDKDLVAVVLFGTKKTDSYNREHNPHPLTYIVQDLVTPEGKHILQLEEMWTKELETLKKLSDDSCTYSLSDAFWLCSSVFMKKMSKQDSRQVLLFTNNDTPHAGLPDRQEQARSRAVDLIENDVQLSVFPLKNDFNVNFYKELINIGSGEEKISPSLNFNELLSKVRRKVYTKRSIGKIEFRLGAGVTMSASLYNLIREAPKPRRVTLDRRTNEPVKPNTTKFSAETAGPLLPSELVKSLSIRGHKIVIENTELKCLKHCFPHGLTLMGFKPIDNIRQHLFIQPASFLYPDDNVIQGSRLLFGALLERCNARKIAPICSLIANRSMAPRLVALLPEMGTANGLSGFHILYLPYSSDIRHLPYNELVGGMIRNQIENEREIWRADCNQVCIAKEITRKLRTKDGYYPEMFEDPSLHTMWNNLEAMALDREDVESHCDATAPDKEYIDKKICSLSEKFKELVVPIGQESVPEKDEALIDADVIVRVEEAARQEKLGKLSVDTLRKYLSNRGIRGLSKMKKSDLIKNIQDLLHA